MPDRRRVQHWGRGTVATGRVGVAAQEDGSRARRHRLDSQTDLPRHRMFRKTSHEARAGDKRGRSAARLKKEDSSAARSSPSRGRLRHIRNQAEVYVLSKEKAAVTRRSSPI